MRKLFFPILLLTLLTSCNVNTVFSDRESIPDMIWERTNILKFTANINEISSFNLFATIRYIQGYPYQNLKFKVRIFSLQTNKEVFSKNVNIDIRDIKSGKYIGDGSGDFWDLTADIQNNFNFEDKGEYEIQIVHLMSEEKIPYINDIGFEIRKTEK